MQDIDINTKCIYKDINLKPKVLFVDNFDKNYVSLKPCPNKYDKPLWFSRNFIFKFKQELYDKLKKAFNEGNKAELEKIWLQAEKWEPTN